MTQHAARISGLGAYVPLRRMHNDELTRIMDTTDEWIYTHTGIRYRHIAAEDQAASDLAIQAAHGALDDAHLAPDDIDLVLVATSTPDYVGLPSTACVVQDKLRISGAAAMDLVAACSGFVYALETARTYVTAGAARHVLVIGSEIYSRIVNWKDRKSSVLFGDGAGAAIVSALDADRRTASTTHIFPAYLRSRGSGAESLCRLHGGTRHPYIPGVTPEEETLLQMDGRSVYTFAVAALVEVIQTLLEKNRLSFEDITWVVPHQANTRIITAAARRGEWSEDKFYMNIEEYANTSAASIPIALREMKDRALLSPGDLLLLVGFGSGLTYGGNLVRW